MTGSAAHLLVLRGWVPRDPQDRTRLPALASPAGPVEITGVVLRDLPRSFDLGKTSPPQAGERIWQNPSLDDYAGRTGLVMLPFVLRQSGDGPTRISSTGPQSLGAIAGGIGRTAFT